MAGNICRCGAYPKIERAILRASGQEAREAAARQDRSGRWRGASRTSGCSSTRTTRSRRGPTTPSWTSSASRPSRQDGPLRAGGTARFTVDVALPGMLHALVLRVAVRALPRAAARPRRGAGHAGRARRARARTSAVHDGRRPGALPRSPRWAGASRSRPSPPTRPRPPPPGSRRSRPSCEALPPRRARGRRSREQRFTQDPRETVRGDPDAALARRRRADRADLRDARPPPDARSSRTPRSLAGTGTRSRHGSRPRGCSTRARRARAAVRAPPRAGARDLRVHRRRVRREAGRGGRGASRSGARARGRTSGSARARPPRGAARRRAPILDAPDGDGSARGATGRSRAIELAAVVSMGAGGWIFPVAEPGALALRVPERARDGLSGQDEPSRPERVPRAGSRRGGDRARAGDGRARGRARDRPARAAPREPRRPRPGHRAFPTPASACSPATTVRPSSPAGSGATSCASSGRTGFCAAWAARRRSGGEAAGRPPMRRCASTPRATRW